MRAIVAAILISGVIVVSTEASANAWCDRQQQGCLRNVSKGATAAGCAALRNQCIANGGCSVTAPRTGVTYRNPACKR